jgi:hypothetical protein
MQKKAAMEMSMGTIVTIVLLIAVLILGLVFVRKIMCSGIILTDKIDEGLTNEITSLFGQDDYGVKCMGESGQQVKVADGGTRQIFCVINSKEQIEYNLKVKGIESLDGVTTKIVESWILDQDWKGKVSSGKTTKTILVLNIPDKVDNTNIELEIEVENLKTGSKETHNSYVNIVHVGGVSAAIC